MSKVTEAHEAAVAHAIEMIEGRWRATGGSPSDRRAPMGDHLRELLAWARAYTELPASQPVAAQAIVTEEALGTEPEAPQTSVSDTPLATGPDALARVTEAVAPVVTRAVKLGVKTEAPKTEAPKVDVPKASDPGSGGQRGE